MIDQLILIMFGWLIVISILGKLLKPVLWIVISLYVINKISIWIFDTWIFGLLYAYFFWHDAIRLGFNICNLYGLYHWDLRYVSNKRFLKIGAEKAWQKRNRPPAPEKTLYISITYGVLRKFCFENAKMGKIVKNISL